MDEDFQFSEENVDSLGDHSDVPFGPPEEVIEVACIHCGGICLSCELILKDWPGIGLAWTCPFPGEEGHGCGGVGFCFDLWPTDPHWRDENGHRVFRSDDEDDDDETLRLNSLDLIRDEDDVIRARQWTPEADADYRPIDQWRPDDESPDCEADDEDGFPPRRT